jgi:FkbM family methyltransferase
MSYPYETNLSFESKHLAALQVDDEATETSAADFIDIYQLSPDYQADFKCIITRTTPPTTVCIYDAWRDMYISHDLEETGMWEPQVLADIQEALMKDESAGFIDVGANIGFYTLIAANMGRKVVAVEPFYESCYRLHRSAAIQKTCGNIVLLHNAVADHRVRATIRASGDNQGDTRIVMKTKPCTGSCPPTVNTILLNDLVSVVTFSHAVMKLDVQGYEHKAMQHVEKLLDHVYVSYIFMEWILLREFKEPESQSDHFLVEEMLLMLFKRNYRPYSLNVDGGGALNADEWDQWPNDIVWHRLLDTDEKSKVMRSHFFSWP